MKQKFLFLGLLVGSFLSFTSCNNEDEPMLSAANSDSANTPVTLEVCDTIVHQTQNGNVVNAKMTDEEFRQLPLRYIREFDGTYTLKQMYTENGPLDPGIEADLRRKIKFSFELNNGVFTEKWEPREGRDEWNLMRYCLQLTTTYVNNYHPCTFLPESTTLTRYNGKIDRIDYFTAWIWFEPKIVKLKFNIDLAKDEILSLGARPGMTDVTAFVLKKVKRVSKFDPSKDRLISEREEGEIQNFGRVLGAIVNRK